MTRPFWSFRHITRPLKVFLIVAVMAPLVAAPAGASQIELTTIRAWGANADGQLGNRSQSDSVAPVSVLGASGFLENITQVAGGAGHTVALTSDGKVFTWGRNNHGQLGVVKSDTPRLTPAAVEGLSGITAIAANGDYSLALDGAGKVWMWGSITSGTDWAASSRDALRGCHADIVSPQAVGSLANVQEISAGANHALARIADGTVRAWGVNDRGQLGNGTIVPSACNAVEVLAVDNVGQIAAGSVHSLALRRGTGPNDPSSIYAWGGNTHGQIGDSTTIDRPTPVPVQVRENDLLTTFVRPTQIAAGGRHSLAVRDEDVWSWGDNRQGQLGLGSSNTAASYQVPNKTSFSAPQIIGAGGSHSFALKGNRAHTWGSNSNGQLGRGSIGSSSSSPALAEGVGGSGALQVSAAENVTMAIVAPKLSASSSSLAFPSRLVNTTSTEKSVSITNDGPGRLRIGQVSLTGGQFSLSSDGCSNTTLDLGANCRVGVKFVPTIAGSNEACLRFPANTLSISDCLVQVTGVATTAPGAVAGGKIAFSSDRSGVKNLYSMNIDGTKQLRLTNGAANDFAPSWAPDASRLVFVRNAGSDISATEIHTISSAGGASTQLTTDSFADLDPQWSPLGDKIAFSSNRSGNSDIFVMNTDGSGVVNLTNNSAPESSPTWSPDGTKIGFIRGESTAAEIYTMGKDGTGVTRVTDNNFGESSLSWSPDGRKLAFVRDLGAEGGKEIFVVSLDGTGLMQNVSNDPGSDTAPEWSPDSLDLVFSSNRTGNYELFRNRVTEADSQTLLNLSQNASGDFDGDWINNLKVTANVSSINASPPFIPNDVVPVYPGSQQIQDAGSTIIDSIGSTIIDSIGSTIIDSIGSTIIDSIGSTIIDSIEVKVVDGIGSTIIDSIGSTIIDSIGSTIIDSIGSTIIDSIGSGTLDPKLKETLQSMPLDSLQLSTGSWNEKLADTKFASTPAQSLTFYDYLSCVADTAACVTDQSKVNEVKKRLEQISIFGVGWDGTRFADLNILSLLTADIPNKNIPGIDWKSEVEKQGLAFTENDTLLALQLKGLDLQPLLKAREGFKPLYAVPFGNIIMKNAAGQVIDPPINRIRLKFIDMYKEDFGQIKISDIPASTRGNVVDCSIFDCTKTLSQAQVEKKADGTNFIKPGALIKDLGGAVAPFGLGHFALTFIDYASQKEIAFEKLAAGYEDPAKGTTKLRQTFTHVPVVTADANPIVKVTLPKLWTLVTAEGFAPTVNFKDASGNPANPPVRSIKDDRITLTWDLEGITVPAGQKLEISYWVRPWLQTGVLGTTASITTGDINEVVKNQAPVQTKPTHEGASGEGNDTPESACRNPITTGNVYFSQIERAGDRDFFCLAAPPEGSKIKAWLRNTGSNNELVMYHPKTSVRPTPLNPVAPADNELLSVPDEAMGTGIAGEPLAPDTHNELILEKTLPIAGLSDNKGLLSESITARSWKVSGPGPHYYLLQVAGAVSDGGSQFSSSPYALTIGIEAPSAPISCGPRTFAYNDAPQSPSVAVTSLEMSGKSSVLVVNRARLHREFGTTGAARILTKLDEFVASPLGQALGAVVVPVDGNLDVVLKYAAWDQRPCDVEAMRDVTRSINGYLNSVTVPGQIRNVAIIGSPLQVPYGAAPDLGVQANEDQFAGDVQAAAGNTDLAAALTEGNILTDAAYLGAPIPWGSDWLYLPTASVARIGAESPEDVVASFDQLKQNGTWDASWKPQSILSTGYDFFDDGAREATKAWLEDHPGATKRELYHQSPAWTKGALRSAIADLASSPSTPTFATINAHYSPFFLQPQAAQSRADLADPQSLLADLSLSRWGYGSIGCHSLISVPNSYNSSNLERVTDWSEALRAKGAQWGMGQLTYGLGCKDQLCLSERLLKMFAGNLDGSLSVGDAARMTVWDYFAEAGSFGQYDRKAILGMAMSGLPFVNHTGSTIPQDPPMPLSSSSISGLKSHTFRFDFPAASSAWKLQNASDGSGQYYTLNGQAQWTPNRAAQPVISYNANGQDGLRPVGVLVLPKQSTSVGSFDPAIANMSYGADAPEPQFAGTYPAAPAQVRRLKTPAGPRDSVTLIPANFRPSPQLTDRKITGTQLRWLNMDLETFYQPQTGLSNVGLPPVATSFLAVKKTPNDPKNVTFIMTTNDQDVALAMVSYRKGGTDQWENVKLRNIGGAWVGDPKPGDEVVEFFVQLCNSAGVCGINTNEGAFHSKILEPLSTDTAIKFTTNPSSPAPSGWFTDVVTLDLSSADGTPVEVSVNGSAYELRSSITFDKDGIYRVHARRIDLTGEGFMFVPLDITAPDVQITSPADGAVFEAGASVKVAFSCSDATSSIATCIATGPTGPVANGGSLYTGAPGNYSLTAAGTDKAGHQTLKTVSYSVHDKEAPGVFIFNPPDLGTFILNEASASAWSCKDQFSVATCPEASVRLPDGSTVKILKGANLPTSLPGRHLFSVTAKDAFGNSSTLTHAYSVNYAFTFLDPPSAKNKTNAGERIPISWTLQDALARFVSDPSSTVYLASYRIDPVTGARLSSDEVYDASQVKLSNNKYQFGWTTKSEWANTTRAFLVRTKDLEDHILYFTFIR